VKGSVLESVVYRLHVRLVSLGPGDMRLGRDTSGAITRHSVSGHTAVNSTLARKAGDVGDTGDGSTVLADRREGRQGEHASTT
jgi:ribosomal protein L3